MRLLALGRRKLRNWLGRYRNMPWLRIAADYRRAARLRRSDAQPRPGPRPVRLERVVVTLTTVPDRVTLILPAVRSLLDQTWAADRIILAWPRHSIRSGVPYPPPPPLPEGVEILHCEDQGPATKLLPALRAEPDAILIVADDDVIYPEDFIETLVRAHRKEPTAALGWRGWKLEQGRDPRELDHVFATAVETSEKVDILLGTWGYLVPPHVLGEDIHSFENWPKEVRWVDDIWISGHLARRGVIRRVIPATGLPIETRASAIAALTFGPNRSGEHDKTAIEAFRPWW